MFLIGTHKVFGHYGGRFHFADVTIEIRENGSTDTEFELHLEETSDIDQVFNDWKTASIIGLRRFSNDFPRLTVGKLFEVHKILATLVDTEDETIEVTSYMAAFKALCPDEPLPQISFDGSWTIKL